MGTSWLAKHWVAGAAFMAGALLLVLPGIVPDPALRLVYLASPLYMLHQIEEHAGDRFRTYVNDVVFGGVQALSVADVLVINLPGVWGINLLAFYAALAFGPGWGLAAAYLILVNGIAHVGMAVRFRGYNPGLVTGALAFIPFGVLSLLLIPARPVEHVVGLVISLVIHAAIIVRVKANTQQAVPR
ncbi:MULTISPECIES: HXXEE domain-containing protein [Azorhizobium]|uniref:HXXEE domain-containing protein n=1 Tax=Azorhizobium TaxID=6 RepID=UPI0010611AB8|nr:HXXEE domain-containing protein [Azorhizobium sp. AG788]TDU00505.1 uncharacterized protein with HXXEE motif [Azorhizobium sp. AG788]